MKTVRRIALVLAGGFILYAATGSSDGTVLGLYPPTTAELIGYDAMALLIDASAILAIYRGIRPTPAVKIESTARGQL